MTPTVQLVATARCFLLLSLVVLTWFVVGCHGGCGQKISQAYLAGAIKAEYPGITRTVLTMLCNVFCSEN